LLITPGWIAGGITGEALDDIMPLRLRMLLFIASAATAATALWWLVLYFVLSRWPHLPGVLFRPFGDRIRAKWMIWLLLISLAGSILSLVMTDVVGRLL
jgi:hypothetical protein